MDSLHEDLNRVKIKPLVPWKEYNDIDSEVAEQLASEESWRDHLNRNQSIIVDLMHGQFKSTVRCPEPDCNHISVSFEPYSQISLPIPQLRLLSQVFMWIPYDVS